ncbi:hypothetical protein NESM_000701700 [Novymonas esmeraldas]|uniref:Uncharacterized protein n=1 Tax=Novymonas esmeraldas TaxID=1808958 RepID=A0AAW0EX61_9TRYP
MSSSLVLVGKQQVLPLVSRIVVGIRLQGTIGYIDPAHPYIIKPRPYATYLATTLRRLQCAVVLFVPTNAGHDQAMMDAFYSRDFTVPFRFINDHSKFIGAGGGRGNRKIGLAPNNYTEYLRLLANELNGTGQDTSRILFVDAEVNYRFTPVQTIVLDAYQPLTRRQTRDLVRSQSTASNLFGGGPSSRHARRHAAAESRAANATVHHRVVASVQQMEQELHTQRHHTQFLMAEQDKAPPPSPSGVVDKDTAEDAAGLTRSLAINMEDHSLVALAEMVAEMTASDMSVADYIRTEPLIEKVEVPFHGKANYLAPENCDDIDLLHWDEIEVMEQQARDMAAPATVVETDEHKGFFR